MVQGWSRIWQILLRYFKIDAKSDTDKLHEMHETNISIFYLGTNGQMKIMQEHRVRSVLQWFHRMISMIANSIEYGGKVKIRDYFAAKSRHRPSKEHSSHRILSITVESMKDSLFGWISMKLVRRFPEKGKFRRYRLRRTKHSISQKF